MKRAFILCPLDLNLGGAWYISSHAVQALIRKGYDVIIYDSLVHGHREAVPGRAIFIRGDLSDSDKLDSVFRQYDIDSVMHFAAYAYVKESMTDSRKYLNNNYVNSLRLLDSMVNHNVYKIIFSSSCIIFSEHGQILVSDYKKIERALGWKPEFTIGR